MSELTCTWCGTPVAPDAGYRAAEPAGERRAVFCRLEHVVPWVIQGADWLPGTEPGPSHNGLGRCAWCAQSGRRERRAPRAPSRSPPDRGRVLRHAPSARVGEGRRALAQRQLDHAEDRRPTRRRSTDGTIRAGPRRLAWGVVLRRAGAGSRGRRSRGRHVRPARPRRRRHAARPDHARHLRPARRGGHRRGGRAGGPRRPQHGRDRGDPGRRARAGAHRAGRVPHGVPPEGRREPAVPRGAAGEPGGHRRPELRDRAARRDHPRLGGPRRLLPPLHGGRRRRRGRPTEPAAAPAARDARVDHAGARRGGGAPLHRVHRRPGHPDRAAAPHDRREPLRDGDGHRRRPLAVHLRARTS